MAFNVSIEIENPRLSFGSGWDIKFPSPHDRETLFSVHFECAFVSRNAQPLLLAMKRHFIEGRKDVNRRGRVKVKNIQMTLDSYVRKDHRTKNTVIIPNKLEIEYNIVNILEMFSKPEGIYAKTNSIRYHRRSLRAGDYFTPEDILFVFIALSDDMLKVVRRFRLYEEDIIRSGFWDNKMFRVLRGDTLIKIFNNIRHLGSPETQKELILKGRKILERREMSAQNFLLGMNS